MAEDTHARRPRRTTAAAPAAPIPPAHGYRFSEQAGHLLRRAYQRHTAIFHRLCPDPELTSVQFAVLCVVNDRGPCSLTDIGQAAAMDPATTRGIAQRLQKRKLIALAPDRVDKRKVLVSLRPEGERLVAEMIPHAQEISRLTVASLNPAEHVALTFLLGKLG